jgi:Asp-tRNA(Asn)/Glu-tRNA(Gln) amidotransferase B subunit
MEAYGFLMGQVMRKLSGSGNPDMVKEILKKSLEG